MLQSSPVVFNKAATMNIGFLEARTRFHFDCVMFHDVDHLLEDDRTLMNCGPEPHHFALAMKEWDYRWAYGALEALDMTFQLFSNSFPTQLQPCSVGGGWFLTNTTVGVGRSRSYCNTEYNRSQGGILTPLKCIDSISFPMRYRAPSIRSEIIPEPDSQ